MSIPNVPQPRQVVATRRVLDERWIRVRADVCIDAAGREIAPFYIYEQPDWASIVAFTASGDIVVAREYRHGAAVVGVGLPGGVIDAGETPEEAAQRELREETGYVATRWVSLDAFWVNPANQDNRVHLFLALDAELTTTQHLDDSEMIAIETMTLDTAMDVIEHGLHQVALLKAERWLRTNPAA